MPIAEACHVALQRHPLDKQAVWRHMQVGAGLAAAPLRTPPYFWRALQCPPQTHAHTHALALDLKPPARPAFHPQARHDKLGAPRPALRVVSYHADTTNRAPTFDIDIDDLYTTDAATGGLPWVTPG